MRLHASVFLILCVFVLEVGRVKQSNVSVFCEVENGAKWIAVGVLMLTLHRM